MSEWQQRAVDWIGSQDTGASSKSIWVHMMGGRRPKYGWAYPHDPDDLGRCLRLLRLIPEWKPRLPEMATRSAVWAGLVAHWDEIASMMADEVGIDWEKGRSARRTYHRMKEIIDPIAYPPPEPTP